MSRLRRYSAISLMMLPGTFRWRTALLIEWTNALVSSTQQGGAHSIRCDEVFVHFAHWHDSDDPCDCNPVKHISYFSPLQIMDLSSFAHISSHATYRWVLTFLRNARTPPFHFRWSRALHPDISVLVDGLLSCSSCSSVLRLPPFYHPFRWQIVS